MNEKKKAYRQFIEEAGDMLAEHGMPHMAGRVIGSLLISEMGRRSLDELAEDLDASRGSISMATRLLIRIGLVQRVSVPGERRNYYQVREGSWAKQFVHREEHIDQHFSVLEKGLALLKGQPIERKMRLLELLAFFDFIAEEVPGFVDRWEERKEELLKRRMHEFA